MRMTDYIIHIYIYILYICIYTSICIYIHVFIYIGVDPLSMLTNDGNNAKMISEGLPADRISIENGSIITNCKRWPLLIDPQTQGTIYICIYI
jgi:hypothetical protein